MRGLATAVLTICFSAPAWAGHGMPHDRIPLPTASPAYITSNGDRYNRLVVRAPRPQTDLERLAVRLNAGNGRADFFNYRLSDDDNSVGNTAVVGTVSNGAAQLQFRWTTE